FIFTPIFVAGRVVGFGASVAHHLDLGGGAPGLNIHASDVYQEGIRFPPSRYSFEHDWNGGSFERLVTANVRVPDLTIGDFNAQFAANAIGALRVKQLCERYGADKVEAAMAEMQDYSERRVRAAIAQAPKGTFYGEDAVDDDGQTDEPLVLHAKVTIAHDPALPRLQCRHEGDGAGTARQGDRYRLRLHDGVLPEPPRGKRLQRLSRDLRRRLWRVERRRWLRRRRFAAQQLLQRAGRIA